MKSIPLSLRLFIQLIAGLALILLHPSCRHSGPAATGTVADSVARAASSLLVSQPAKALALVNRVDTAALFQSVPDSQAGLLLKIKGDALMRLDRRDSAYLFMQWSRNQALEADRQFTLITVDFWLGQHYSDDGKFFLADKYITEAISHLHSEPATLWLAEAYSIKGNLESSRGSFAEGQKYQVDALKIYEKAGDTASAAGVLVNMGNNYVDLGDLKQALPCLRRACTLAWKAGDTINYLSALNNLGRLFLHSHTDSASACFKRVLQLNGTRPWSNEVLAARFHLAGLAYDNKDYQSSLASYRQILDTCRRQSIWFGIYRSMSGIGNVYEALNKDPEALQSFTDAYTLARENREARMELSLLDAILYMHKKAGDFRQSFATLEKIKYLGDSLLAVDKQLGLHDLEMMYNIEKANLRNAELNANVDLMKRNIRSKNIILALTVVFILSLTVLLYSIYRLYRQRDHAYHALIEKYRNDEGLLAGFNAAHATRVPENEPRAPALSDSRSCFDRLTLYFETDKPYLNPRLKIETVTQHLGVSRKTLANCLQEQAETHFIAFVNGYRVREALQLLASPEHSHFKIDHIAGLAGFGSKVAFYTAFTQVTGAKPGSYRKKSGTSGESSDS